MGVDNTWLKFTYEIGFSYSHAEFASAFLRIEKYVPHEIMFSSGTRVAQFPLRERKQFCGRSVADLRFAC